VFEKPANLPNGLVTSKGIHTLIEMGILDAPHEAVQPASVDTTMTGQFMVERRSWWPWKRTVVIGEQPPLMRPVMGSVKLRPNGFCLCSINEQIKLPRWLKAGFVLNSTAARCGLDHAMAVWIDPGFCGRITVEYKNNLQYHNILLSSGDRAGQLFFEVVEPGARYDGRYQWDNGTAQAKSVRMR